MGMSQRRKREKKENSFHSSAGKEILFLVTCLIHPLIGRRDDSTHQQ